ncbi:hypothetical protein [Anoxybacillus sp. KU2-6(11)]|uniref:hypothetical protein n=1 Tax=Anoxybacillus sp. KU2-6(11) TaxID=1535751 RepID=UPI000A8CE038|nr:hypothetical protein [Anoxybacillus sp. KU2-6(11)]
MEGIATRLYRMSRAGISSYGNDGTNKAKKQQHAYQIETMHQQIAQLEEKCAERRARVEKETMMWHEAYPDLSFEQIDALVSDLREREREAQQLQQRIEKAFPC